jgi:creatinine amidohydrolase
MNPSPERRFERLRPAQIWRSLNDFPCVFAPSGPLEWHGLQNPVGLDAVKARELCLQAADISGGLVFPATFAHAHTVPWPLGMPTEPDLVEAQTLTVLRYLAGNGVRAIIWLSGHGGTEDYLAIRKAAVTAMEGSDCVIWAGVDAHLITDLEKPMDHAAAIETSLLLHLASDTVDLDALDPDPAVAPQGVGGDDPRTHATAAFGKERAQLLIERLANLATRLVGLYEDPIARGRHRECLAQQVELDGMIAYARAHLPANEQPSKEPEGWSEHLEAFRGGDYDSAYEAGAAVIARVRRALGRR